MFSEIEKLLEAKNLTEQSKRTYRTNYFKITTKIDDRISRASEEEILNAITEMSNGKVNSELTYINLPIMIRSIYGSSIDKLLSRRELLFKIREKNQEKEKFKTLDIPSYKEIKDYIDGLYDTNKQKYIVNSLIFRYGVRNKDVNVFITEKKKGEKYEDNKNYILIKKSSAEWIRNDYKTLKSYGRKVIIIKEKKLLEAIKEMPLNTYLLSGSSVGLSENSLNTTITRMLYKHNGKNLTEGDYFKVLVIEAQKQKEPMKRLSELARQRGTNLETIHEYYNSLK